MEKTQNKPIWKLRKPTRAANSSFVEVSDVEVCI